jgi:hypothetical protein
LSLGAANSSAETKLSNQDHHLKGAQPIMSGRSFIRISAASLALLAVATGPAAAHNGPHAFDLVSTLQHLLSSADHLAMAAVGLVAAVVVGRAVRSRVRG